MQTNISGFLFLLVIGLFNVHANPSDTSCLNVFSCADFTPPIHFKQPACSTQNVIYVLDSGGNLLSSPITVSQGTQLTVTVAGAGEYVVQSSIGTFTTPATGGEIMSCSSGSRVVCDECSGSHILTMGTTGTSTVLVAWQSEHDVSLYPVFVYTHM
jgi:hypothetical protein